MIVALDMAVVWALVAVIILIALDTLLGWLIAFSRGEFDLRRAPQFLRTNILPYVGSLMLLAIASMTLAEIKAIFYPAAAAAAAAFMVDIKDKLTSIFGKIDFAQ